MKICKVCNESKVIEDFYKSRTECKICTIEKQKIYHKKNIVAIKARKKLYNKVTSKKRCDALRLQHYGITSEDFDNMLVAQNNCCAICGTNVPSGVGTFHVDHNHTTGVVRELLCHHCNIGLGVFKEDTIVMEKAIKYLHKHNLVDPFPMEVPK